MDNLTEEKWEKIIKKEGCASNPLYKTRGEYANLHMYLRVYISQLVKREVFEDLVNNIDDIHPFIQLVKGTNNKMRFVSCQALLDYIEKRHLSTSQSEGTE